MKKTPDAKREVEELKARLTALEQSIHDGEQALSDLRARRAAQLADGTTPDEAVTAEIVRGSVSLDSAREALELVRARLVDAERRAKAEERSRLLAEFSAQERADREALEEVDGHVRALAEKLDSIRETTRKTDDMARQAGFGSPRGRLSNCIQAALVRHNVIDSRDLNMPLSTLRRLAPAPKVEV